jgi:hypothetical protein
MNSRLASVRGCSSLSCCTATTLGRARRDSTSFAGSWTLTPPYTVRREVPIAACGTACWRSAANVASSSAMKAS